MPASVVVAQIVSRYDAAPDVIATAVETLLAELLQENLFVATEAAPDVESSLRGTDGDDRLPFTPLVLEKFTDMADLLLLDPIHDVDDAGGRTLHWRPYPKCRRCRLAYLCRRAGAATACAQCRRCEFSRFAPLWR